nr:hypothetical protein Iba_chr13fCG5290 [Ipomoea batatas]
MGLGIPRPRIIPVGMGMGGFFPSPARMGTGTGSKLDQIWTGGKFCLRQSKVAAENRNSAVEDSSLERIDYCESEIAKPPLELKLPPAELYRQGFCIAESPKMMICYQPRSAADRNQFYTTHQKSPAFGEEMMSISLRFSPPYIMLQL